MTQTATPVVLETLPEAAGLGISEPVPIGRTAEIVEAAAAIGWDLDPQAMLEADSDVVAVRIGMKLLQAGRAEALTYRAGISLPVPSSNEAESTLCCSPHPESACCPREMC